MSLLARPWHGVAAALAANGALLLTLLLAPEAPWRLPVAVLGGVWAPGYALLCAVHPFHREGMTELERHALGFASGLLAAPVVGLGVSLAGGFEAMPVAAALGALTFGGGAVGLLRAEGDPAWMRGEPPGTRATLAICAATLVAAAALWAVPTPGAAQEAPLGLALVGPDGTTASLPLSLEVDELGAARVDVAAGDRPAEGVLRVAWAPAEGGPEVALLEKALSLPEGGRASAAVAVPTSEPGTYVLRATWEGAQTRETHAWIRVVAPEGST